MKSLKAIVVGSLFIIIVGLLVQLAHIFLAVGYNELAKSFPFLHEISGYFRYILGIPVFFLIMFAGGYIAADLAEGKPVLHSSLVALVTIAIMMLGLEEQYEVTVAGVFIFCLALVSAITGGWIWQRQQ